MNETWGYIWVIIFLIGALGFIVGAVGAIWSDNDVWFKIFVTSAIPLIISLMVIRNS